MDVLLYTQMRAIMCFLCVSRVFLVYILLSTTVRVRFVVLMLFLCVPYVFRICSLCAAHVRPAQYSVIVHVMRLFDRVCVSV